MTESSVRMPVPTDRMTCCVLLVIAGAVAGCGETKPLPVPLLDQGHLSSVDLTIDGSVTTVGEELRVTPGASLEIGVVMHPTDYRFAPSLTKPTHRQVSMSASPDSEVRNLISFCAILSSSDGAEPVAHSIDPLQQHVSADGGEMNASVKVSVPTSEGQYQLQVMTSEFTPETAAAPPGESFSLPPAKVVYYVLLDASSNSSE